MIDLPLEPIAGKRGKERLGNYWSYDDAIHFHYQIQQPPVK